MKNNRKNSGFTLAELLIVAAITVVLAGVAFVSVFNHMRSLAQLERDTIAKEIFVAAQNHLTTANSQGYLNLGSEQYGLPEPIEAGTDSQSETGIYYLVIPNGLGNNYQRVFELMLPFGAVDETVRAGGSYVIRYQPAAARILDVFYCERTGRFVLTTGGFTTDDYTGLMSDCYGEGKKSQRRDYKGAVVGWYGGEASVEVGERLTVPTIEIINAERLQVKVTDYNKDASLQLIITGAASQAKKAITILADGTFVPSNRAIEKDSKSYLITLDDVTITSDDAISDSLHFYQLGADQGTFIPGEDISIQAVAFSNSKLTNVARSMNGKTNSLFGYDKTSENHSVALISNIRHLENLDSEVSTFKGEGLNSSSVGQSGGSNVDSKPVEARQTTDLVWPDFIDKIKKEGTISTIPSIHYSGSEGSSYTDSGTYKPVTPDYTLNYNGNNHSISEVEVKYDGDAGIFGTLTGGSISTLLVRDSNISVYDGSSGNAGGLIGSMSGTEVKWCAANGTVNSSSGAAGGLIGSADESSSITACYSAGHTKKASYDWLKESDDNSYDITGATAGGLIGSAGNTTIKYSYSTCSATGATVGGLIGSGSGSVASCYATGLVTGTGTSPTEGAFAGSFDEGSISTKEGEESYYYSIINEIKDADGKIAYLPPIGSNTNLKNVTALDETASNYNEFVGDPADWAEAVPEDAMLVTYYQGRYPLRTVGQLGATVSDDDLVTTHYGDWPAPEIFVINAKNQ